MDSFYRRRGKRVFDFCLALWGLVVLGVPLLVVAGLILAVDGRPVLFR